MKIILQTQHINEQLAGAARKYRGPIDCLVRLYREEGFKSYFKGNLANILRYFPNQAFNFGIPTIDFEIYSDLTLFQHLKIPTSNYS